MITKELIRPQSIVVVGASQDTKKPGGKILKNIIDNLIVPANIRDTSIIPGVTAFIDN